MRAKTAEAIVTAMTTLRPATTWISSRLAHWLVRIGGTLLPLLVVRGAGGGIGRAGVLILIGFAIAVGAQFSLRRSFSVGAANRGIKTAGLYGFVRHPMYLGYIFTNAGFLLANPTGWNAVVFIVWMGCQLGRIHAEERVLSADPVYQDFTRRVGYRLLPFVY